MLSLLAGLGCAPAPAPAPAPTPTPTPAPTPSPTPTKPTVAGSVKVGQIMDMSGPYGITGLLAKYGSDAYIKYVNEEKGGIEVDGKVTWKPEYYIEVASHIKSVAQTLGIEIEWGGDWKSFKDYPHYQLKR